MNKVAFITMDMESFYDTECIRKHDIEFDEKYDCSTQVERFINYLDERKIKCTLFVSTSFLYRCKETLIKAVKNGHEIALHCLEHEDVRNISVEQFEKDIIEAKRIIKEELGIEPIGYRFPCFRYEEPYMNVIKKNGFIYDSSAYDKKHRNKISKENGFYEFAVNLSHLLFFRINLSGGGYLRLMPPSFYTRQLNKCIKENNYYMMYLHPFEIYDGKLPELKGLNFIQKMYVNRNRDKYLSIIGGVIDKLKEEGYSFLTMSEYIKQDNHE